MTGVYGPPKAPSIADIIAKQGGVAPVTQGQDAANEAIWQRLARAQAPSPDDRWGNVSHAVNTAIGYWAGHKELEQAKEQDRIATEREQQRAIGIAEALQQVGIAPEQAAAMATGDRDDSEIVMRLMGMKADQDYRTSQAQTEADRHAEVMGLRRDQFGAQREDAAADRALREQQIAAASVPKEPANIKTLRAMGIDPASPEGRDYLLKLEGGEAAAASIAGTDTSKFDEEMAKASVKEIGGLSDQIGNKRNQLRLVLQMEAAGPGAFAAPFAEGKLAAAQFVRAMGLEVEGTTESELLQSATNQMAMVLRNPDSGGGLPGAASDADRNFLVASVPNLSQSPEGRAKLTKAMRMIIEDDIHRAEAKKQYLIENRGSQDGWQAWAKENLPPPPDIKAIVEGGKKASEPAETPYSDMSDEDLLKALGG